MTSDESSALVSFRSGRRREATYFAILSSRRGRRARRRGPQLRAVHRSADARSTRASPPVVGRAFTRTARRRSSCAEPTRNMKRALVGGTPHVQGSRHREPTVASPGATFARRAAAPSSSTLWTPTHAASWRGPGALAPPLPVRNWFDVDATSGSSSRGPVGQGLPSDAQWRRPSPCSTASPSVPVYSSRLAAAAADLYADQPISTRS